MIADKLLELAASAEAKSNFTGTALDLKQEYPNLGSLVKPFVVIVTPQTLGGTAPITFNVQDSADGTTDWVTVASVTIAPATTKDRFVLPMPVKHRRYVRLTTTVDTSSSKSATGKFSAVLNNVYDLPRMAKPEGYDINHGVA